MLSKKIIWQLNIIDLLIICIIIFSISALVYKSTWGNSDDEYRDYTISFVCENAPLSLLDDLEKGLSCADGDYGTELGKLTDISYDPIFVQSDFSQRTRIDDDERSRENNNTPTPAPTYEPTRAKATFTTEVQGIVAEHGIKINKSVYLKGKTVNLIIGDSIFTVYVNRID